MKEQNKLIPVNAWERKDGNTKAGKSQAACLMSHSWEREAVLKPYVLKPKAIAPPCPSSSVISIVNWIMPILWTELHPQNSDVLPLTKSTSASSSDPLTGHQ